MSAQILLPPHIVKVQQILISNIPLYVPVTLILGVGYIRICHVEDYNLQRLAYQRC